MASALPSLLLSHNRLQRSLQGQAASPQGAIVPNRQAALLLHVVQGGQAPH